MCFFPPEIKRRDSENKSGETPGFLDFKKTESQEVLQIPKLQDLIPQLLLVCYVYFFDFVAIFSPHMIYIRMRVSEAQSVTFCSPAPGLILKKLAFKLGLPQRKAFSFFFEF